jgi:hypothetical protein
VTGPGQRLWLASPPAKTIGNNSLSIRQAPHGERQYFLTDAHQAGNRGDLASRHIFLKWRKTLLRIALLAALVVPAIANGATVLDTHEPLWAPAGKTVTLYRPKVQDRCTTPQLHRQTGKSPIVILKADCATKRNGSQGENRTR